MKKREEEHGARLIHLLTCILAGGGIAFGLSIAALVAGAALIASGRLPEDVMDQVTICAAVLGCFIGGLYGVLCVKSRVLLVGLAVGVVFYLLWMTAGLITSGTVSGMGSLRLLCCGLLGGAAAGFLGARPKKRRK